MTRLENHLPETFWMVEASAQELFSAGRRKFGELLLSSTTPLPKPLTPSVLLSVRLPGLVMLAQPGNLVNVATSLDAHTPLFAVTPAL